MQMQNLIDSFRLWLREHEILDVEVEGGAGASEDVTVITFPINEEDGYPSYDIVATLTADAPIFFFVDYCDIPDVDELELYRYVNELNTVSPLTVTIEEGSLSFSYSIPLEVLPDAEALSRVFFYIWDAIDALREDIGDAFGLSTASEDTEAEETAESENE
ncbi:MAG: hypothetical protein J6T24_02055 [Clostridia bacterium]|nr:hypothetical protein [Clostridia bacterium]